MNVASTLKPMEGSSRPPLTFGDQDLLDWKPNKYVPLLISAVMANVEVRRILVDQGSSANIFEDLLKILHISTNEITPYHGTPLTGLNG